MVDIATEKRGAIPHTTDGNLNPPKRRPRGIIVCSNCRRRKVRCDKNQPCSNCVRHHQSDSCAYEEHRSNGFKEGYMEIQFPVSSDDTGATRRKRPSSSERLVQKSERTPQHSGTRFVNSQSESEESELESLKKRMKLLEDSLLHSSAINGQARPELHRIRLFQGNKSGSAYIADQQDGRPLRSLSTLSNGTGSTSLVSSASGGSPHYPRSSISSGPDLNIIEKDPFPKLPPLTQHLSSSDDFPRIPQNNQSFGSQQYSGRPVPFLQPPQVNGTAGTEGQYPLRSSRESYTSEAIEAPSHNGSYPNPRPFLIGVNIVSDASDTINFYEGYSSVQHKDQLRRLNFGPFAWSSLMKRDAGLRITWDYIVSNKNKVPSKGHSAALLTQNTDDVTDENAATLFSVAKDGEQSEKQFERRALQTDGLDDMIPYKKILKVKERAREQTALLNKHALSLGLTVFDGQLDRELQLIDKIQVVLPKKKVLWKLILRFFRSMYTYMPFLDEDYFRRDVEKIIGPEAYDDTPIGKIRIERKLDLATVGILLVVLRLAYLSLFSNNSSLNEAILNCPNPSKEDLLVQYLMKNPININIIDVATSCLDQFHLLRRSNFTVLQLALYLRLYHVYAPEDGDGADGGDSQVFNAVLIQTAYSLGINREPDEQCTDPKLNNIMRKIWVYLLASDLHLAYSFGSPPTIDEMNYDIKAPEHIPGSENVRDPEKERATTLRFAWCLFQASKLRKLLRSTLDINRRTRLTELCQDLSEFENDLYDTNGCLSDFIKCEGKDDSVIADRNVRVKSYLALKSFLISVYFHIYLHCVSKDHEMSFFYLRKCLITSMGDIMPHYITLLGESEVISDMVINPTIEMVIHKSNQINLSIIVRVNFLIYHLKQGSNHEQLCKSDHSYSEYFQLLCQLSSAVTRAAEFTISAISKLSNRYYYAWTITRGQTFVLKTITLTKFYEDNYHKAASVYSAQYTPSQLRDLIAICEKTLSKFCHTEFCTFGFAKHMKKDLFDNEVSTTSDSVGSSSSDSLNSAVRTTANAEIDKLWLQVLSLKHNTTLAGGLQEAPVDVADLRSVSPSNDTMGIQEEFMTNIDPTTGLDRFGFDMEMANRFDFLSEVPFEGMFDI